MTEFENDVQVMMGRAPGFLHRVFCRCSPYDTYSTQIPDANTSLPTRTSNLITTKPYQKLIPESRYP